MCTENYAMGLCEKIVILKLKGCRPKIEEKKEKSPPQFLVKRERIKKF